MKSRKKKMMEKRDLPVIDLSISDIFYSHVYPEDRPVEKQVLSTVSYPTGHQMSNERQCLTHSSMDVSHGFLHDDDSEYESIGYGQFCSEECEKCELSKVSFWTGRIGPDEFCNSVIRHCLFPKPN